MILLFGGKTEYSYARLSHFYKSAELWPLDGQNPLNYGLDRVRILKPIIIGDGVRLRSHITLLDAQKKKGGDMLLKNQHDIEAEGVEGFVVCAEYLTYWHSI